MKKIIMIAAMLIAGYINAATVTWSATANSLVLPEGSSATTIVAYLFEGSLDSTALQSALAAGTWDGSGNLASATADVGKLIMKSGLGDYENETVTYSMIVFDAATIATAENYKYAEATVTFGTKNGVANFSSSLSSATWQAVPEPTSGLLMLVGLAGLALRRRRA